MTRACAGTAAVREPVLAGWVLAGEARSVARARELVRSALAGHVPAAVLADVELAVSELAGNAVRHSASGGPGRRYVLAVAVLPGRVRVAVIDEGGARVPRVASAAELADPDRAGGRGLGTLACLGAVGWDDLPAGRRRVWAELPCAGAGGA
ncbi:ATP-binding protein (plasmid) [Actinomadura graeca]|uniref:ATP-binding protein n=1 Tax=Actinomadura graeca TaxID=2750812 RepID=A0ABX8R8B1_9ACTN|nr:ATP-binding protein [Actinomadura graeca]QXJ27078.1 ATP-binding protein [Actinomadura graeca]